MRREDGEEPFRWGFPSGMFLVRFRQGGIVLVENSDRVKRDEFRRVLKEEWKRLWWERFDDKFRAEGIANRDYDMLFLDRGTVIFASRDAKIPSFREILEMWVPPDMPYAVPPDPRVGGWRKFIRTELRKVSEARKRRFDYCERSSKKKKQQLKKGGRGWLHV